VSRKPRDVSGLWETNPSEPVDRSPGVAPPPRRSAPVAAPAAPAVKTEPPAVVPTEPASAEVEPAAEPLLSGGVAAPAVELTSDVVAPAAVVDPPSETTTSAPVAEVDPLAPVKTGLSFTKEQLARLHKLADRDDVWVSSVMGNLLQQAAETIRATPRTRRTKSRRGSKYIATTLYLDRADRELLDQLADSTGRSRAAVGRLAVDSVIE